MDKQSKERIRRLGRILFYIYIALLSYFLFFSERYGRTVGEEYRYNLELFAEIRRFFKYRHLLSTESFLLNMLGNVVAFMPFGFFIPVITKKRSFFNVAFLSFELTLLIELMQLIFKVGIFDIDDLFLNTLGGILGYVCYAISYGGYRIYYRVHPKKR